MKSKGSANRKRLVARLLDWFALHKRALPWRATRDPYRVWISEVMLQQTQAATVIPFYERFLKQFPDVTALAAADDRTLMKAWEGLGYYARARHLRAAARTIVREHGGRLPASRAALLELPGFGPYTAAAVASLAFGQDCAAVDGNVLRVLARVYAVDADIRLAGTRRRVQQLADALLPAGRAGAFNEALMELGALCCKPKNPLCNECPIRRYCRAFAEGRVAELPLKSAKPAVPHHEIAIGVVQRNGRVLIALRPAEGLLGNLWEFPGGKRQPGETLAECCRREIKEETGLDVEVQETFAIVPHSYTHFRITLHAFHCRYTEGRATAHSSQAVRWVRLSELDDYAFPKANKEIIALLKPESAR
ncbi:MAG TPA: A/G-specific adenine glycosylase [Blastocatellia bacterium]|nr:A/G-specific adenine glycosylase [Blastocatellia bacterium]